MSRRTAESNKAILAAWNKEQELVQEGKGTREWTPQQQQDILEKGKAYDDDGIAFQGQHMKSAEMYPEYQGDPGNIQFLTRAEHLEAHNGNWRNPTNWYFNPVTKGKFNFGDGPFIPCKIIQLPEPIIKIQIEQDTEKPIVQEPAEKVLKKPGANIKAMTSNVEVQPKNNAIADKPKFGFGQQLKLGFSKIGKTIVEFSVKHPTAAKIIKGVGIVAATITAAVVAESSNSSSSGTENRQSSGNDDYDYSGYAPDDPDETFDDYVEDNISESVRSYTPNYVPAGRQRYHYKDGSVKWKDKSSYHRVGNKDE